MTRAEVEQALTAYLPMALPIFADRWSRWPAGAAAHSLISEIEERAKLYDRLGVPATAQTLRDCQIAIRNHA